MPADVDVALSCLVQHKICPLKGFFTVFKFAYVTFHNENFVFELDQVIHCSRRKIVQNNDFFTEPNKLFYNMAANKSSASSYDVFHANHWSDKYFYTFPSD